MEIITLEDICSEDDYYCSLMGKVIIVYYSKDERALDGYYRGTCSGNFNEEDIVKFLERQEERSGILAYSVFQRDNVESNEFRLTHGDVPTEIIVEPA